VGARSGDLPECDGSTEFFKTRPVHSRVKKRDEGFQSELE